MRLLAPHRAGLLLLIAASSVVACASSGDADGDGGAACTSSCGGDDSADAADRGHDSASAIDAGTHDGNTTIDGATNTDAHASDGSSIDASSGDAGALDSTAHDTGLLDASAQDTATVGIITGGPCLSGAGGATAYRIRFADAGGQAQAVYEVNGLPDHSRDHTEAYGYQIGFTSQFVDPFLGEGGLQLDDNDFLDIEISTAGIASIANATLSIYGRSFDTTTSGSFNWQTFDGTGSTPTSFVSNVAPYSWYSADFTTEIHAGDNGVLLRIKAGPSSDSLVVHRVEICMQAN